MKLIRRVTVFTAALALGIVFSGCATAQKGDFIKEYQSYSASMLPPPPAPVPDQMINDLGRVVNLNYAFALEQVRGYAAVTRAYPEYIAFLSRVNDLVEIGEKNPLDGKIIKFDRKGAMNQAMKEIQDSDAKVKDANSRIWPKVYAGYLAVSDLNPSFRLAKLFTLPIITSALIAKDLPRLQATVQTELRKYASAGLDPAIVAKVNATRAKSGAVAEIAIQSANTGKLYVYLTKHFQFYNDFPSFEDEKSLYEKIQHEYKRFSTMPPAPVIRAPYDRDVDNLAVGSAQNNRLARQFMKDLIDFTSNHEQYLGFLNDVECMMQTKKMDRKAAYAEVKRLTIEQDKTIKDPKEKIWPRVAEAINASRKYDWKGILNKVLASGEANLRVASGVLGIIASYKEKVNRLHCNIPTMTTLISAGQVLIQVQETTEACAFMGEQIRFIIDLENLEKGGEAYL